MNTQTFQHTHWQISAHDEQPITGLDDLHQCICNILNTRKGSDVLRPNFGSDHFDYLDQPFDVAVPNMVREIFTAIAKWEKRVVLKSVDVSGIAPHFAFQLQWQIAESVEGELHSTDFTQGVS